MINDSSTHKLIKFSYKYFNSHNHSNKVSFCIFEKYSSISILVLISDKFTYVNISEICSVFNQSSSSIGTIDFTLSFLSIIEIVFTIFSTSILSRNQTNNFLLFIFITKSQKFNSFSEL
ncbi:MAG: hypothetical protein Q8S84_03375 [bacterium]|nr:hypothetical protein [bacterium]MDP3380566.1 hypothetical protein [bacterium]